jgi:hypothetical protein
VKLFPHQKEIRQVKNRMKAHLLELRLFVDEPAVIWQAQKGLIAANGHYLALMARPLVIIGVPMTLLVALLDPYFGVAPLPLGRSTIVTVQLSQPMDASLELPDGITVETSPVRIPGMRQVSWRIRPDRSTSGALRIGVGGVTVEKKIEAGEGPRYTPARRTASMLEWLATPGESLLPAGPVEWIQVGYPRTNWLASAFARVQRVFLE